MFKRLVLLASLCVLSFNCLMANNHTAFSKIWDETQKLEKENKFEEAEQSYFTLIEKTQKSKDMYWELLRSG